MIPGQRYKGPRPVGGKGRKGRKAPVTPTETDVARWRKLAAKAAVVAADPLGDALGFVQAAEKAGAAVAPVGHRGEDSPFMKLVRLGKRFLLLSGVQRQAEAGNVRDWAEVIVETLDGLGRADARAPYSER
ncbi:MAG: hypothetical protein DI552_00235 [Brevundimonas sp.]|uniref:hypothetical protein n=1 Tax=Brevundimonas sp. TaxID=1871086 RepID=UPI000DBC1F62|nr:hypothetical protein [Brevundimonas sp.]PZU62332.1 MAG: hypothetical protein DI552_00235 [Brevundimonas sp.]